MMTTDDVLYDTAPSDVLGERRGETRRYKVRFDSKDAYSAALSTETVTSNIAAELPERNVISIEVPSAETGAFADRFERLEKAYGARIVEDYRYQLEEETDLFNPRAFVPESFGQPTLDDVTRAIGAQEAWSVARGAGVTLAIVDTGIAGSRPEFPAEKRHHASWAPIGEDPWVDGDGHGSMCAAIAAGTASHHGEWNGVAPDAKIMACRSYLYDTELAVIYTQLARLARAGEIIVASNSFGVRTGAPPPVPDDSDFIPALDAAIEAGVYVFFSAGNYHRMAGGTPDAHEPNSIWLHKGRSDVMTIGAAKPEGPMWYYSSRGPGQFPNAPGTNTKPDAVGLTPENGRIVYGANISALADGWGTSGCCPQAAGLAALMLSRCLAESRPLPDRDTLFDVMRRTCRSLGHHPHSEGAGRLDCAAAVSQI